MGDPASELGSVWSVRLSGRASGCGPNSPSAALQPSRVPAAGAAHVDEGVGHSLLLFLEARHSH